MSGNDLRRRRPDLKPQTDIHPRPLNPSGLPIARRPSGNQPWPVITPGEAAGYLRFSTSKLQEKTMPHRPPPAAPTRALRFLRIREVMQITGCSRASIYRGIKLGTFPAQIKTGPFAMAFIESEVVAWMQDRIAASRAA